MKHSGQTVLWELWAALCLCTALVLPPGSPWLHEPALLYPGLMLAAARARRRVFRLADLEVVKGCNGDFFHGSVLSANGASPYYRPLYTTRAPRATKNPARRQAKAGWQG